MKKQKILSFLKKIFRIFFKLFFLLLSCTVSSLLNKKSIIVDYLFIFLFFSRVFSLHFFFFENFRFFLLFCFFKTTKKKTIQEGSPTKKNALWGNKKI
jgi:hypothetical protein